MEEKDGKRPKMSEFCEELMSRTENMKDLKKERDCAIVMCSDGDILSCRIMGSPSRIITLILRQMIAESQFAQVVSAAVHSYIMHLSNYMGRPLKAATEADDKEIKFNLDQYES